MIIVLDTNSLVQVFGARSPFLPIPQAILDGRVVLAFSTAILLEYEEVLTRYGGPERWLRLAGASDHRADPRQSPPGRTIPPLEADGWRPGWRQVR